MGPSGGGRSSDAQFWASCGRPLPFLFAAGPRDELATRTQAPYSRAEVVTPRVTRYTHPGRLEGTRLQSLVSWAFMSPSLVFLMTFLMKCVKHRQVWGCYGAQRPLLWAGGGTP